MIANDFISLTKSWVVMGPDPALLTCMRCGDAHEPPGKVLGFEALTAYINGLCALHSGCPGETYELEPGAPGATESGGLVGDEFPSEAEPAAALPAVSRAFRTPAGGVFFDCRVHGTGGAAIQGGGVKRTAKCVKCDEAVPYAAIQAARQEGSPS